MSYYFISHYQSPIGLIEIKSKDEKICSVLFIEPTNSLLESDSKVNQECISQLQAYFNGTLTHFNLPTEQSGTPFQNKVWNELLKIEYGSTTSYLEIAKKLGDEKSVRAIGTSNGKNQLLILFPCHRVIGSNGNLIGYAGGLDRKEWLLKHEIKFSKVKEGRLF